MRVRVSNPCKAKRRGRKHQNAKQRSPRAKAARNRRTPQQNFREKTIVRLATSCFVPTPKKIGHLKHEYLRSPDVDLLALLYMGRARSKNLGKWPTKTKTTTFQLLIKAKPFVTQKLEVEADEK